jgi:hypothetical protein
MMKRFYGFVLGVLLLFNCALADNEIRQFPREINGIGAVQYYQTGKNTYVGINPNLEMLYIATATGSGFTHPGYMRVPNEIVATIKSYYQPFQKNQYARKFNKLSQKYANIPQKKFSSQLTAEVLNYGPIFSPGRMSKGDPRFAAMNIQEDLRRFYDETDSIRFWAENLPKYNEMTANFVARYRFDYVSELEDFFGVTKSTDKFEILLSPLYNGGSAVAVENPDKTTINFSIINPFLDDISTINIIIHENAHNFLWPVLNKNHDLINRYQKYLKRSFGKSQGFVKNDHKSFLNELLARTITISILDKYHNSDMAYSIWFNEKMQGWDNLDEVYALIKNKYLPGRDKYPRFEDFLPVVLEYFEAKSNRRAFDTGPKVFERQEIKAAQVHNAYWEGDPRIPELKANKPHSFLLEVEFSPRRNPYSGELISDFFNKAGFELELTAAGKPKVTARIYEGNIYRVNGVTFWGFWAMLQEAEFTQLEPAVIYKLVPRKPNLEYPWMIDENVTVVLPNP